VLDDRYAGGEQHGVSRPFAVRGVIDVECVDADECCVVISEPGGAGPGKEVRALARVSGLDSTQGLQGQADLGKGSSAEYYPEQCPGQSAGTAALSSFRSSPAG